MIEKERRICPQCGDYWPDEAFYCYTCRRLKEEGYNIDIKLVGTLKDVKYIMAHIEGRLPNIRAGISGKKPYSLKVVEICLEDVNDESSFLAYKVLHKISKKFYRENRYCIYKDRDDGSSWLDYLEGLKGEKLKIDIVQHTKNMDFGKIMKVEKLSPQYIVKPQVDSIVKVCAKCGREFRFDYTFCSYCGNRLC